MSAVLGVTESSIFLVDSIMMPRFWEQFIADSGIWWRLSIVKSSSSMLYLFTFAFSYLLLTLCSGYSTYTSLSIHYSGGMWAVYRCQVQSYECFLCLYYGLQLCKWLSLPMSIEIYNICIHLFIFNIYLRLTIIEIRIALSTYMMISHHFL